MIVSNTRFLQTLEIERQKKLAQEIARAQTQISTGKRLLAPSDDPIAAARISQIGRQQGTETAWGANIDTASALAARADTALASVANALDRAKELMLTAVNGTQSADGRAMVAVELRSIALELQSLADSKDFRGGQLFSDDQPLSIPVGNGLTIAPVDSRANVFESVVTASGTMDLASIVNAAADALEIGDDAARLTAGKDALDALDAAMNHIATARGEQGLRAARLDALAERLEDTGLKLGEERSNLEETDVAEAIARLQSRKVTLDAAQAIYAQLNQRTLFDLLR